MTYSNRGLYGQPVLPYVDYRSYMGVDAFIDMTFLDYTMTPVAPVSITYQLDDITNAIGMIPATALTPNGTPKQTLQLSGSLLQMTHNYQGSQLCQLVVTAGLSAISGAYPANISALLHFDSTPIIDSSSYSNTVTVGTGSNPPVVQTTIAKFGAAASFPATTSVLNDFSNAIQIPITVGGPLDVLTTGTDFTIDGWVYLPSPGLNTTAILDYGDNGAGGNQFLFAMSQSAGGSFQVVPSIPSWSGAGAASGFGTLTDGWHYFAIVRQGNSGSNGALFFDGNRVGAPTNWVAAHTQPAGGFITIGAQYGALGGPINPFYLDELRVIKGTALYAPSAATITPPTGPMTAPVLTASSFIKSVSILELIAIQTPTGS